MFLFFLIYLFSDISAFANKTPVTASFQHVVEAIYYQRPQWEYDFLPLNLIHLSVNQFCYILLEQPKMMVQNYNYHMVTSSHTRPAALCFVSSSNKSLIATLKLNHFNSWLALSLHLNIIQSTKKKIPPEEIIYVTARNFIAIDPRAGHKSSRCAQSEVITRPG